jgi:hypothetical protein
MSIDGNVQLFGNGAARLSDELEDLMPRQIGDDVLQVQPYEG